MQELNIKQYLCIYSNRYIESLLLLAAGRAGVLSKELAHGTNCISYEERLRQEKFSSDYYYFWRKNELYEPTNINQSKFSFLGHPKYSLAQITKKQKKFKQKEESPFSQSINGITSHKNLKKINTHRETERKMHQIALDNILGFFARRTITTFTFDITQVQTRRKVERYILPAHKNNVTISSSELEEDLFSSEIAIGFNTSCLYEAMFSEKRFFKYIPLT